jgi:hypothetical protein
MKSLTQCKNQHVALRKSGKLSLISSKEIFFSKEIIHTKYCDIVMMFDLTSFYDLTIDEATPHVNGNESKLFVNDV